MDWIIVAIVALGAYNGFQSGLIRQVVRLFGALVAYILSLWLRPYLAPLVGKVLQAFHITFQRQIHTGGPQWVSALFGDMSGLIAFAIIFAVVFLFIRYAAGLLEVLFRLPVLSLVNRLAGLLAGALLALVLVYVATLVVQYLPEPWLQHQLAKSVVVEWMDKQVLGWHVPTSSHI